MSAFAPSATLPPTTLPAALVSAQGVGRLRFASAAYSSRTTDSPASTLWEPRLLDDAEIAQSVVDAAGVGGRAGLTISVLDLRDEDGWAADLARWHTAAGRVAEVRTVDVRDPTASDFGTAYAAAAPFFVGVVSSVAQAAGRRARLTLSDRVESLNTPLQASLYGGTGGTDGTADLTDQPKPVLLGECYNLAPVFLGGVDLGAGVLPTYQVSWRAVEAITAVRIRGVAQTLVTSGTPGLGEARTFASQGLFQLGATPDGDVTCDAQGDNVGGYVDTTVGVLTRMLTALGPGLALADFDASSLGFAETDLPGTIGIYLPSAVSAIAATEEVLAGSGAFLTGARNGRLRISDPLAQGSLQIDLVEPWIVDLRPEELPVALNPTPRACEVAWRRNWSPLRNIPESVAAADRQTLADAQSAAQADSALVTGRVALQRVLRLPGLYREQADALARAEKWRDWLEKGPRMVTVTTDRYLGQVEVGHTARVTYSAFGLSAGLTGVVVAFRERAMARRLEMTILGVG